MSSPLETARLEYASGRYRYAIQFAQYALAREPDDVRALQILGMSCLRLGDYDSAISALEHLSVLRPLDDDYSIELSIAYGCVGRARLSRDLLMILATSGRLDASQFLRVAAGLEAVDEPRLAMEACRQAGRRDPDAAEVHFQMGYYAQRCGYHAGASEALIRNAVELEPNNLHYRIGLASLLIRLGREQDAYAVLDRAIPRQLDDVTCCCCLKRIANLFFDCGDVQRARLCAEQMAALEKSTSHRREAGRGEAFYS